MDGILREFGYVTNHETFASLFEIIRLYDPLVFIDYRRRWRKIEDEAVQSTDANYIAYIANTIPLAGSRLFGEIGKNVLCFNNNLIYLHRYCESGNLTEIHTLLMRLKYEPCAADRVEILRAAVHSTMHKKTFMRFLNIIDRSRVLPWLWRDLKGLVFHLADSFPTAHHIPSLLAWYEQVSELSKKEGESEFRKGFLATDLLSCLTHTPHYG